MRSLAEPCGALRSLAVFVVLVLDRSVRQRHSSRSLTRADNRWCVYEHSLTMFDMPASVSLNQGLARVLWPLYDLVISPSFMMFYDVLCKFLNVVFGCIWPPQPKPRLDAPRLRRVAKNGAEHIWRFFTSLYLRCFKAFRSIQLYAPTIQTSLTFRQLTSRGSQTRCLGLFRS